MFTDKPTTPVRLEAMIDLVRNMAGRKLTANTLKELMQPPGLPGLTQSSNQAAETLSAAKQLDLITEDGEGQIRLASARERRTSRAVILEAIDAKVLAVREIEPWFALFYAFLLGKDASAPPAQGKEWEIAFNRDVLRDEPVANRFNETKYNGLRRWMRYAGLGWHDGRDTFNPNPYERVQRQLSAIFGKAKWLDADTFMSKLASHCPELDGGWVFKTANPWFQEQSKTCSAGLSHALIDLHLDGVIALDCPPDSAGWSLEAGEPPLDGAALRSPRFAAVTLVATDGGN